MAAPETSTPTLPGKEQWGELCREVKAQLLEEMGEESWYLIIVSLHILQNTAVPLLASCLLVYT